MTKSLKQPKNLYLLTLLVMLIMIGFETTLSLLVLYCTRALHFNDRHALGLFSVYAALLYAMPVLVGYAIERYISAFAALLVGSLIAAVSLAIIGGLPSQGLIPGLSGFVVGTALMVPSLYILLGQLYVENDKRRDSGFTFFYMGMNLGALIAIDGAALIQKSWGYSTSFVLAAFSLLLVAVLMTSCRRFIPHTSKIKLTTTVCLLGFLCLAILWSLLVLLLHYPIANSALVIAITIAGMLALVWFSREFDAAKRRQMHAFLLLCTIAVVFWTLYMLAPSLLTLFIERNVNHTLAGFNFPASMALSLNAFFILVIGAIMTRVWLWLEQRQCSPSLPYKFAGGIVLMGAGYLIIALAISFTIGSKLSMWWIVLSYFLQTSGELFLSPTGLAIIGQIAPKAYEGYMLSLWNVMVGTGACISGYISKAVVVAPHTESIQQSNQHYQHDFLWFGLTTLVVFILVAAFAKPLQTALRGVKQHEA